MAKSKQKWRISDVFSIPTSDGRLAIGQVIGQELDLLRSVTAALFDEPHDSIDEAREQAACDPSTLFAILFVTVNHLESGDWKIVGHRSVTVDARFNPHEHTRSQGFDDAKVAGSGIVNDFVEAFYGLAPCTPTTTSGDSSSYRWGQIPSFVAPRRLLLAHVPLASHRVLRRALPRNLTRRPA